MLAAGGLAMVSTHSAGLMPVFATLALLFLVCVALHTRLYDLRPEPRHLTLFYLTMSAGGRWAAVRLIAPLVFDWVWEHPLLVLAAAALLPRNSLPDWRRLRGLEPEMVRLALAALLGFAAFAGWLLHDLALEVEPEVEAYWIWSAVLVVIGLALVPWRGLVLGLLLGTMLVQGGLLTLEDSREGIRTRSYFGIYTVRDYAQDRLRTWRTATLHGEQSTDPALRRSPRAARPGIGRGHGAGARAAAVRRLFVLFPASKNQTPGHDNPQEKHSIFSSFCSLFLNSFGDTPVIFLNILEK